MATTGYGVGARMRHAGGFLAALMASVGAQAQITGDVLFAPSPQPLEQGSALVYEIGVRNGGADCARLTELRSTLAASVQVRRSAALVSDTLVYDAQVRRVPNPSEPGEPLHAIDVPPGGGAIVYFFQSFDADNPPPPTLRHEFTFTACAAAADAGQSLIVDVPVSGAAAAVVGLPFRGEGWVATDSTNAGGTHRRTLIPQRDGGGQPIPGRFHAPERYAIDWVVADADGSRVNGPVDRNASYLAHGAEIIAVADGVVVDVRDGMPENTPPYNPPGANEEMAAGNYVMQDIGGGRYAFYAHLQPGSLRVRVGQPVVRGQALALLGNSGNSSEPHLHFHLSDANHPLQSEGLPFVHDCYHSVGQTAELNEETGLFDDVLLYAPRLHLSTMPRSDSILDADPELTHPFLWWYPPRMSECLRHAR